METFADYILSEKNLVSKIEIAYYLSKKTGIFFDKSVLFKTEILRQFIEYMKLDVDENMLLTAGLLCNCKKVDNAQKIGKLQTYAMEGAVYLSELGFEKRFCKICEEINRYSGSNPRERESDILELVDQFGGMLLNRPERIGLQTEEAIVLLQHRNLKDVYNRYLETFIEFVNEMDSIPIGEAGRSTPFKKIVKIFNETADLKEFIRIIAYEYAPTVNALVENHRSGAKQAMFDMQTHNPNRALFSEETTKKIMGHMDQLNASSNEE